MIGTNSMSFFLGTIFLFFSISSFSNTSASLTRCRPDQRDALLEFKDEFELRNPPEFLDEFRQGVLFPINVTSYPKTKSWANKSDCCYWHGITCDDANSGLVIGIDLSCSCLHGHLKPNSSLFKLRHLRNLNLAYNDFNASPIPTEINKLMELQRLNLSYSSFSGKVPAEILHLNKLVSLDLSSFKLSQSPLFIENPFLHQLTQNLTNLRTLDMSYVNISSEIPYMISNLTSLRSIRFHDCHLFGRLPPSVLLGPNVQSIDLSINPYLKSSLPEFNGNNSLVYLDLSETSLSGIIPDSIGNLKHLKFLRFHGCNFTGKIPSSIGRLSHLTSLTISSSKLSGSIPSSIGNLSHLNTLQLDSNNFAGEFPSSFQNLNRMTGLSLLKNKLSGSFPTAILNLTKLSYLSLASNQFTGTLPPNITSLSNLNFFDATANSFVGTIPSTFFTIPSLEAFLLRNNHFNGPLEIGNISSMSRLQVLDLSRNNFTGPIPRSISKLVNLVLLDLSYFNTRGPVEFGIFWHLKSLKDLTLSHLNTTATIDLKAILSSPLKSLSYLDLSSNQVSVKNISSVSTLSSQLKYLVLSGCGITGFPEFMRTQQDIFNIDLSNNNIKGQVPGWLWRLPELKFVDLSNNTFSGFIEFPQNLSKTKIEAIYLGKNNISGEIPTSICDIPFLNLIDFSNNNLNGSVPQCFSILIKRGLSVLNLGNNHLSGKLPDIFLNGSNLRSLNVGHNQLVGKLPRSLSDCSSLEVINLEHNRFKDTFPFWLKSLERLQILVFGSNEFHGSLQYHPQLASWFPQLRILDISHNVFTGTLPSDFFMYWTSMKSEGDRSELKYIGDSTYYTDSMVLMNKGVEMHYTRILTLLTAIDLSGNRLQGNIPDSIGLVKALMVLNLSSNYFTGNIPSSLADLTQLESLDLSHNKLSGQIPQDLAHLTSLSIIRVSHNKLVGMVPKSTQFQTQNVLGFEDNIGLCGPPLDECGVGHVDDPTLSQQEEEEEEEEEEEVLSWIAAAIGFIPGIVLGLTIGHFLHFYKPHWFFKVFGIDNHRRRRIR